MTAGAISRAKLQSYHHHQQPTLCSFIVLGAKQIHDNDDDQIYRQSKSVLVAQW